MMDDKGIAEEGEIHDDENDVTKDDKEDVPDNFFDDFNNEGFMESLQIVDSLDETNLEAETEQEDNNEEEKRNISIKRSQERTIERNKIKKSHEHGKRSRSREKKHRNESPRRKRKFDNSALRRDPNKTKRDLERDRENFAKKKEQKVISKIVETGLVPPGMECEVNLNVIENSKVVEKRDISTKLNENESRPREQKLSRDRRIDFSKEQRRRSRSRSYGRLRSRSRGRRIERSRENRKSSEKRIVSRSNDRSRDRGRIYEPDFYSPTHNRRRRSRSGSDRERWLKERNRSPERKYRGMIREKKMSFLEEIKLKLNGDTCSGGDMVTYPFPKNPVQPNFPDLPPMPVGSLPHYNQNYLMDDHSAPPMSSSYNEDFFIGNQSTVQMHPNVAPLHPNVAPMHPNVAQMHPNVAPMHPNMAPIHPNLASVHQNRPPMHPTGAIQMMPIERIDQPMVDNPNINAYSSSVEPVPPPASSGISVKVSELMARISASTNSNYNQTRNAAQVEKKWSLTDVLHLSQPTEFVSDSDALKKKVDVLSRCQDFLKELSGDKKFSGKLKVTKTSYLQKDERKISPLLRQRPVTFSFNTPMSENNYQDTLKRTLIKLGIVPEVIDLADGEQGDHATSVPAIKRNKVPFELKSEPPRSSMSMKMCQTDPVKCEDCEKRKAVQYRSIGVQCGESERFNVGVQVVEEDIINSRIPKNQSLAYMTPAQLLGRSEPVVSRTENYGLSSERLMQHPYRDPVTWSRARDYYGETGSDYQDSFYYGTARDMNRDPRYPRF